MSSNNYIEYKLPFIFSSNPIAGAKNISTGLFAGSSFEVVLDRPLYIPREAKNCYITVQNATAWWVFFNITTANNKIGVEYDDGIIVVNQTLTIEPGLYDLDHLSAEIGRELNSKSLPQDLFILVPDQATQKVVIQFNYSLIQLDLSVANNFADLLGFNERLVPLVAPTTGIQYEKGDTIANFNTIDGLLLHTDLVSRGLRINQRYLNVIAEIPINVEPGSQILYTPFNPPQIPSNELIGETRKVIRVWLTDSANNYLNTQGEHFTCRLVIHYSLPIDHSEY